MSDESDKHLDLIPVEPESNMKDMATLIPDITPIGAKDIERTLSQVINLNNDNEVHEPTCLICSSPLRIELEAEWDKNARVSTIQEIFKSKTGKRISKEVVDNHMHYHCGKALKELQKVEYIGRLQRLKNQTPSTLSKLDMAETIIFERIMGMNSLPPGGSDISQVEMEKVKSSETSKLVASLSNLWKLRASILGEMKDGGDVISLPTKDFIRVFTEELASSQVDIERRTINRILDRLKKIAKN